jgi:serine/threonine protein kinase
VKICDLRLSKRVEDTINATTSLGGTPTYFAPELHEFRRNPKSADRLAGDMWTLGDIAFELMSVRRAFANPGVLKKYQSEHYHFPSHKLIALDVCNTAIDFVQGPISPDPESRPRAR